MKKTIKQFILILIMFFLVLTLSGCGNKLIATKKEDGTTIKYEIKFNKNKVSNVKMTAEYESQEYADEEYQTFELINSLASSEEDKLKFKKEGKTVIMVLTGSQYAAIGGTEELTKEKIKQTLEEEGFTVK